MTSPPTIAPSLRAERLPLDQVPVVDFRPFLDGDPAQRKRAALELAGAFRNMGFAYLAGHGVDQALIDRAFAEAGRFFAWPAERKAEVSVERSPCDRGWFDLGMENLDPDQQEEGDLKEGYRIGNDLAPDHPLVRKGVPFHGPNQWPAGGPEFRQAMEDYQAAVHRLAGQVTAAVAVAWSCPRTTSRPGSPPPW
jgi:isopenicillin N synthase-like dioxygenase